MSEAPGYRVDVADSIRQLRSMNELFADVFDERDTYTGNPPGDEYLQDLLGDSSFIALTASTADECAGALAAYELRKFEQQRSEIYIYDLAVRESHRRKGVATALIDALRLIAQERGAWVIFVQADTGEEDAAAIALYEKLGAREEVLHFDIPVVRR